MESNISKMETNNKISPQNSPHSTNGSSSNNTTPPLTPKLLPNSTSNLHNHHQIPTTPRSDPSNPYPTTFVQADTTNFKQVVQMLTGSTETAKQASDPTQQQQTQQQNNNNNKSSYVIPPVKTTPPTKKQSFKLYERRHHHNSNRLMINTLIPCLASNNITNNGNYFSATATTTPTSFSPRNKVPEILSPSLLDFPKLALSPVTPLKLNEDPFNKTSPCIGGGRYSSSSSSAEQEERAIAEKGFYLHPSPMSTPRETQPQLLSLFPVTSPKISGST